MQKSREKTFGKTISKPIITTMLIVSLLLGVGIASSCSPKSSEHCISLYVDNNLSTTFKKNNGEKLTQNDIENNFENSLDILNGFSVKKWYIDKNLTNEFTEKTVTSNLSLYGSWEYVLGDVSFYPYRDKFDNAVKNDLTLTLNGETEICAWIDYVFFYDVTKEVLFTTNLGTSIDEQASKINDYIMSYSQRTDFQTISFFSAGYYHGGTKANKLFFKITDSNISYEAQKQADKYGTQLDPQTTYVLKTPNAQGRTCEFDNFKSAQFPYALPNISTSEQLLRALQNGFKPLCKPGSLAETVYNKAKSVLRQIVDDSMNDVEKARRIYEWLILNVQYDHKAYNLSQMDNWLQDNSYWPADWLTKWENDARDFTYKNPMQLSVNEYVLRMKQKYKNSTLRQFDAWFADGALINGVAVCEGISKAYAILCNLENIPCLIVANPYHVWNKVLLKTDNTQPAKWFAVDATQGGIVMGGREVITFTNFLYPDSYKMNVGSTTQTADISCKTLFDFYKTYVFNNSFDLFVENKEELDAIISYAKNNATTNIFYFEVAVSSNNDVVNNFLGEICQKYSLPVPTKQTSTSEKNYKIYHLLFNLN